MHRGGVRAAAGEPGWNSVRKLKVGFAERINPNDSEHTFSNTAKIVSANDGQALDEVARVYAEVVSADLCRASGIRVAEAANGGERADAVSTSP